MTFSFLRPLILAGLGATVASSALAQAPAPAPAPAPRPAAPAPSAPSAPVPPVVVGVLDLQRVMTTASAPKSLREQLERQRSSFQAELSKRENELRTLEQDLGKQRATLSAEQFAERRRQFETQVAEFQKTANGRRQQLGQAEQENFRPIEQAVNDVLKDVARDRGLTLVLAKQTTPLFADPYDITTDVIARLDRKLPRVTLKMPALKTN